MHLRGLLPLLLVPALAAAQPTRERGRFSLQGDPATFLAIDPAVKYVVIGFNAGGACIFPADQRTVAVYTHPVHKKAVTGAVFLDGETFATVSLDGTLKTWKTAAALKYLKEQEDKNGEAKPALPKPVLTVTAHSGYGVNCLAVSPDGKRLATGAADGSVRLWTAAVKQTASLPVIHPGGVRAVAFSPDSKVLATAGADKTAKLWDVTGDKPAAGHKFEGHEGPVTAVAFGPDGKQLAAATGVAKRSGAVHVWDATTGKAAYKLEGHEDVVTCVVFHPKDPKLASGGADKKVHVWDLGEKRVLFSDDHAEPLRAMVLGPDGARLGTCSASAVRWFAGFDK